jgi:hypothetical protein
MSAILGVFAVFLLSGCNDNKSFADAALQTDNSIHQFIYQEAYTNNTSHQTVKQFRHVLNGLHYDDIVQVTPEFWKKSYQRQYPFPTYLNIKHHEKSVDIDQIHFMQNSAHDLFHQEKFDIVTTAKQLQNGQLEPMKLPTIHVWEDTQHRIWTLNHRRLISFHLSNRQKNIPVIWASAAEVKASQSEYTTRSEGNKIYIYLTEKLALIIQRK